MAKTKTPHLPRPRLSAEAFVRAWQMSQSVDEFCEKTGHHKPSAHTRAAQLRAKGIPLKMMYGRGGGAPLDVVALASLAASLARKVA